MDSKFEVVISGVSGKFPECDNATSLKDALYKEKPLLTEKEDRWPTRYKYKYTDVFCPPVTGKIKDIKTFDVAVFKMTRTVAECTGVSIRGAMEPVFEAIIDAGYNPYNLNGRNIGVFTTLHHCDNDVNQDDFESGRLWVLGSCKSMMANRLSFAFDLRGPSTTYIQDINGSFLALNEAYKMISEGRIEAAIVGVVSCAIFPTFSINLSFMNLLSRDSVTRVFDKNADGYARSDAFVALYLERAEDAKRNYGTIDFSGYTYYGSNPHSLLAYDEKLLTNCMREMYEEKKYDGYDKNVAFVETSASAIRHKDRIECNAIANVLCERMETPLLIGSVKSNVGNTEGAGPFVGLLKAIFAMETGSILRNLNIKQVDDHIEALCNNKLKVITKETPVKGDKIIVNAVGMNGSLSQVIVKRNPRIKNPEDSKSDNLPRLVLICGRNEDGTHDAIKKLKQKTFDKNFISLVNDVFSTDMPFHKFRGYTILSPDPTHPKKSAVNVKGNKNRPIWFLFSGMGSQWNLMGNGLLDVPIFADTVRKCHDILKPKGIDIYHILTSADPTIFDNIIHAFVGIITIQIGLVEILKALGIKADGIIGHSVGENACAYADGCLSLEQAVLSSYARGLASVETDTIKGMMAAIGKGYNQIKNSLPANIEVACHNSSTSCTISGPAEDVNKFVQHLQEQKVFAKAVNVANIAYHSKYIAPAAPNLLARLQEIIQIPIERSSKWISTSVPESSWQQPLSKYCSAEYLTNNLLSSVLFEEGCKHIPPEALVIEIAPHGLLQAILKRSLPSTCTNVSLTRRNNENKNLENLLTAIADLYMSGCDVNINALYPPIQYPVPRETHSVAPFAIWNHDNIRDYLFRDNPIGSCSSDPIKICVNDDSPYSFLKYHRINDQIILPTSFFLYLTWWVFSIQNRQDIGTKPIVFYDIHLFKNIYISLKKSRSFTIYIQKGSGTFEILKLSKSDEDKTTKVMTGVILNSESNQGLEISKNEITATKHTITSEQFYNLFKKVGYKLEDTFCSIQQFTNDDKESYANIKWNDNWVSFIDALLKLSIYREIKNKPHLMYSRKIRKLEISPALIQQIEKGSTVLSYQNFNTKEIICQGVSICGIQNEPLTIVRDQANIKLEGLRFISHQNPRCQTIAEFLSVCLQIASDNVALMTDKNDTKLNIVVENDESIATSLKSVVKKCPSLKSKVVFWKPKDVLSDVQFRTHNIFLVVTDNFNNIRKYTAGSLLLLILQTDGQFINVDLEESFVQITKQQFADNLIVLYKNKSSVNEGKSRVFRDDIDWMEEYAQGLEKAETTFIVKKGINFENLSLMLFNEKYRKDHRYMFIMDEEIPNDTMLKNQLVQNLPVSLLQNKEWGSYRAVLEQPTQENEGTKRKNDLSTDINIQLESVHIQYFNYDFTPKMKDEICEYGIEYSGLHASGERVMGLSSVNTFKPVAKPDSNLMWKVPKTWSLEDAATIPFIYASAFNILNLVREKQSTQKVLININNEGLLAQACIALSLQKKYMVYVSVSNDQEAAIIKAKFPQINSLQILNRQICNYETEVLMATKGDGVDLIINCLPGIVPICAMFHCVAKFGHCVQIADFDEIELQKLDLMPFLKSVSFVVVPNKIKTLLKLSDIEKKQLQVYIQEGIRTGIIIPFNRDIHIYGQPECLDESEERNFIKTLYKFTPQDELGYINQKIQYDNNHSYIVVGEKKDTSWFELVEWLITKGARKFIIAIDNFFLGPRISHQMNRLLNQKKATIILTSSLKIDSIQDAIQLVDEANNIAPLEAIFFVSMESAEEKIQNIDLATKHNHSHIHLISIFSGGLKECEFRRYRGSPALIIHGKKPLKKLSPILPHIDGVLEKFDNSNSPVLYRVIYEDNPETRDDFFLRNYLPSDIFTMESIGSSSTNDAKFIEVQTRTPRLAYVKNMTPIFVISALGPKPLQGLFSNLINPAFCAMITNLESSITQAASKLYESLNQIQSKEGVTLIAETWMSAVALEILSLLERDSRKYRLFIIEGNPIIWKERIKAFGPIDSPQFENNLITHVFRNDTKTRLHNNFGSIWSLEDKIRAYLSTQNYPSLNIHNLANFINILRNGLTLASNYENEKSKIIKNTIVLLQHAGQNDEIMKLSMTSELFVHEENDYYKFITSKSISIKINDNVLHNVWYNRDYNN